MLQMYKSGILTERHLNCSKEKFEVNHGIVIVGYGSVENEKVLGGHRATCNDYWIIRNSWGERWGQDGFFKLCADNPFSDASHLELAISTSTERGQSDFNLA